MSFSKHEKCKTTNLAIIDERQLAAAINSRGGSRTAASPKMECFVIIVNGWKLLTFIAKRSILDVGTVLYSPLNSAIMTTIFSKYAACKLCNRVNLRETTFKWFQYIINPFWSGIKHTKCIPKK